MRLLLFLKGSLWKCFISGFLYSLWKLTAFDFNLYAAVNATTYSKNVMIIGSLIAYGDVHISATLLLCPGKSKYSCLVLEMLLSPLSLLSQWW